MALFSPRLWRIILLFLLLAGIARVAIVQLRAPINSPVLHVNDSYQNYITASSHWLKQHRTFIDEDIAFELQGNIPAQFAPTTANGKAILLIHGLSDGPFTFSQLAPELAKLGFYVRVMRLAGHGIDSQALHTVSASLWHQQVRREIDHLKQLYPKIWLGGFSTGGNLATYAAINDKDVQGLLLLSPAFKPRSTLVKYVPYLRWITDWVSQAPNDNPFRYAKLSSHGVAAYYQTTLDVRRALTEKGWDKRPVIMMLSEHDETIDSQFAAKQFKHHFDRPSSQLLWVGESKPLAENQQFFSSVRPDLNWLSGSHIALTFSQAHPFYGQNGQYRFCEGELNERKICLSAQQPYFGSSLHSDKARPFARASWQPYFSELVDTFGQFSQ